MMTQHPRLSPRLLGLVLGLAISSPAWAATPFSIIDLPDTQNYNKNAQPNILGSQVQWILNNKTAQNISFVTQLGDFTDNGTSTTYWNNGLNAINNLNGVVPYSISLGNHDVYWDPSAGTGIANCKTYVGDATHQGGTTYSATAPNGLSFAQVVPAGGYSLLHLNLNYAPDAATMAWAQTIINANPGKPTIVSTHDYMNVDGSRSANGNSVWNGLVNNNAQIFMVLAGHNHGESKLISTDAAGRNVAQLLLDSQDDNNGGNGWMRQITFDPDNSQIKINNFSPTYVGPVATGNPDRTGSFTLPTTFNLASNSIALYVPPPPPAPSAVAYTQNFDTVFAGSTTTLPTGWVIKDIAGDAATFNTTAHPTPTQVATATVNSSSLVVWDSTGSVPANFASAGNVGAGSAANRALGTSPANVAARVVELSLKNDGTSPITGGTLTYDVADFGTGATSAEENPGFTLFYSLTGGTTAADWTQVSVPVMGTGITANLTFSTALAAGSTL